MENASFSLLAKITVLSFWKRLVLFPPACRAPERAGPLLGGQARFASLPPPNLGLFLPDQRVPLFFFRRGDFPPSPADKPLWLFPGDPGSI